uniref:centrosome and spindle pole-associated protein 1 isoform X8 n=1 Tax=Gasterosteus aculeatus aculeatus TaxID=481459 RepID=UPI001A99CC0F|nr:centrosome and spindle pole-associated protein 1 isoform X8 [Gasterosteus aculeatus aculeatus]
MPPASAAHTIPTHPDTGLGFCLLLGTDYERKKKKLQQELQLDYEHHAAKIKDLKAGEPPTQTHGVSLPIDEKISVQEKLREERRREYNLFLQEKAQIEAFKRGNPPVTSKTGPVRATNKSPPRERPASRRDAASLTEPADHGESSGTWGPGRRRQRRWHLNRPKEPHSSDEEPMRERSASRRDAATLTDAGESTGTLGRRRWQLHRPNEHYGSEEESIIITDREEESESRRSRRRDQLPLERDERRTSEHTANSEMQVSMRTPARSRAATSDDIANFATGLMIGASEDRAASQMRKEQYQQDLLRQISERQRNKIREKNLELGIATHGAKDQEKLQLGAVNRRYDGGRRRVSREDTEQRAAPGMSHLDYSPALSQLTETTVSGTRLPQGAPTMNHFEDGRRRNFSNRPGEVSEPRAAGVPPPSTNNYRTPHDAGYYYYGTSNPLHLDPPYNQNVLPGGRRQFGDFHSPRQRHTEATDQPIVPPYAVGELPADNSQWRRQKALSHQEALRQQIIERQELKRRETEENHRYDAKIEAEMMAYNPWGRCGGGASIKDGQGNLISDLNQMHRTNEESCRNPVSRRSRHTQSFLMTNGHTPVDKGRAPLSHRLPDGSQSGSDVVLGFSDQREQLNEDLKQQIEDNKQRQREEKERLRIKEEKEDKMLADQRARIQQRYDEEQRKEKISKKTKPVVLHEHKQQHQEQEQRVRQEEEIEKKPPENAGDREEKKARWSHERREPSPPIPTLQRKRTHLVSSRPSSVESRLTSRTEGSVSTPHSPAVPEKISQLDGQKEVIRELSTIRNYLRNEQRQLEVQLGQTDLQETRYPPPNRPTGRPRGTFESMLKQTVQPPTRNPFPGAADTASREGVRHMYPDPAVGEQSLDIQQQALLREQERKIRLMKREEKHDSVKQQLSHYPSRNTPASFHRDSILPSETTLIGGVRDHGSVGPDQPTGDWFEPWIQRQGPRQASRQQTRHRPGEACLHGDGSHRGLATAGTSDTVKRAAAVRSEKTA